MRREYRKSKIVLNNTAKGVLCICGGFIIQFSLGTIYTFGNMNPYIASYLRNIGYTSLTSGDMIWIFSVTILSQAIMMPVGGLMAKKIGVRITCLIGSLTMSLGTIFTYFSVKSHLGTVIFTYGFLFGTGSGLVYSNVIAESIKWFPNRKGLVTGAVISGYGLGSLVFNLVQTKIINPNNISPNSTSTSKERYFVDPIVLNNIPICFIIIGCAYAAMQILGIIILMDSTGKDEQNDIKKSEDKSADPEQTNDSKDISIIQNPVPKQKEYELKEIFKDPKFWLINFTFFFNGLVLVQISSLYKSFGQTFINNDVFFSVVGSIASLFNAGGRLFWGKLMDLFSYRIIMTAVTILTTFSIGLFYVCSLVKSETGAMAMFFIWVCLLFLCLAGSFAVFPVITSQTYGNSKLAIVYGFIFTSYALSTVLGALVFSFLLKIISFVGVFVIGTVSSIISLILTQFFRTSNKVDPEIQLTEKENVS